MKSETTRRPYADGHNDDYTRELPAKVRIAKYALGSGEGALTSGSTPQAEICVTERLNLFEREFSAAMVVRLIDKFLPDTAQRLVDLRQAVETADAQAVARAAHGLKGSYGNIGSEEAADLCERLEQEAQSGSVFEADRMVERLEENFPGLAWLLQAEKTARTELIAN
jgi:HPt (histidine-containing phosphotransfer) domain-containing protein